MRKLLALLMVLCMLFSVATVFAGCEDGGKKKSSSSKKNDDDDDEDEDEEENEDEDNDENKDDENKDDENKDDENKDDENGKGEENPTDPEPDVTEPTAPVVTEDPKNQYQDADAWDRLESDYAKQLDVVIGLDVTYIEDIVADFVVASGTMGHYTLDEILEFMQDPDLMDYYMENEYYYDDYMGNNIYAEINEFSYYELDDETIDSILAAIAEDYDSYGFNERSVSDVVGIECSYEIIGSDDSWTEESYAAYALLYNNEWLFFTYNAGEWEDGEAYEYAYFNLDYFLFDIYYIAKDM